MIYYFIIIQVIFRHFFSVGIGNELLPVCYNFNYPIQSTKLILSTFSRREIWAIIEVVSGTCVKPIYYKLIDFFCCSTYSNVIGV